jgi:hypothetical protein
MLLAFFPTSKVTKEAEILQEDFSLILSYQKKLLPDSNNKQYSFYEKSIL